MLLTKKLPLILKVKGTNAEKLTTNSITTSIEQLHVQVPKLLKAIDKQQAKRMTDMKSKMAYMNRRVEALTSYLERADQGMSKKLITAEASIKQSIEQTKSHTRSEIEAVVSDSIHNAIVDLLNQKDLRDAVSKTVEETLKPAVRPIKEEMHDYAREMCSDLATQTERANATAINEYKTQEE
ncbi:hypothetical protein DM02DRAFT_710580 [Periconia macrospinosa]|uniref:Uncharacterized protein n=1 Tax=Periconia macrospinosa TaxID=97972 RepID=A0A2V1DQX5_9PLEO|nr:hypothetical protein DM02DRAFT_710580 [Periconia macrospinosa]